MATDAREQLKAGAARIDQANWRVFPQFEALLATVSPELLGKIETTCRQLDALAQNGTAQEKERAQSALAAYARTLELYKRLAELRNDAAAGQTQPDRLSQR